MADAPLPPTAAAPSSCAQLDRFCALVLEDPSLHDALRAPDDVEAFTSLVIAMGRDRGLRFTANDVRAAMHATWRVFAARSLVT